MLIDIEDGEWFNRAMTVFHLKYRPQKISDLDLNKVSITLKKILESKDIPQSFLFAGPKGAGKTSAARIFTKALNCLSPEGVEPCGKCENCAEITNGNSMDVIEMDAASNRGIEDIRSLKDRSILMPSKLKYKVFIVDEVHMLTKEAFNAMLKLIEEPPKHTIFIMCTTDMDKIPDTILSRLIKVDFTKGGKEELKKSLKRTIVGEDIKIDEETIDLIIKKNDGSFRNLQKTFNEIFLNVGNIIAKLDVENFFSEKLGDYECVDFEKDLSNKNAKLILEKIEKMAGNGVDFVNFKERLIEHFQGNLLSFYGIGDSGISILSQIDVEKIINLLIIVGKNEKGINVDQLPLELAVIEFCGDRNIPSENIKKNENKIIIVEKKDEFIEKKEVINNEKDFDFTDDDENIEKKEDVVEVTECIIESDSISCVTCTAQDVEKAWGQILANIKPINHSVEAFLRASRPKAIDKNVLIVEVFYPFHKDRLEEAKNRKIVENGLTKVLNTNLAFECVLSSDKKAPLVIRNDTPMEKVSDQLAKEESDIQKNTGGSDIYDVAKEIFG